MGTIRQALMFGLPVRGVCENRYLQGMVRASLSIFWRWSMSTLVKNIEESQFQSEVIESELPVLVDFWAEWCGPCLALGPVLEQVASERQGKIKICKVNVEEAPELAARFNIRAIPYMAFIKGGQKVGELVGNQAKQSILKAIDGMVSGS
jgi:thioredoxin 1